MTYTLRSLLIVLSSLSLSWIASCSVSSVEQEPVAVKAAHLGRPGGDEVGLAVIRSAFAGRNPGYQLDWREALGSLSAEGTPRIVFVQAGEGRGTIDGGAPSELTVGDIVLLRPGEELRCEGGLSALVFEVPDPLPEELPGFIRPDWDPSITDTPGGCAEETGAYRRILLTWKESVGPYVYHGLNAHRVRITDSFSHYHPLEGGFDEFYLVQMVQPGAHLLTSDRTERIESPGTVTAEEAGGLLESRTLAVGDLVYLPRGTVHRGVGGVLAQVITAPGFVPGAEIGVDHHLRAIDERLGLEGEAALPYHEAASLDAVVK